MRSDAGAPAPTMPSPQPTTPFVSGRAGKAYNCRLTRGARHASRRRGSPFGSSTTPLVECAHGFTAALRRGLEPPVLLGFPRPWGALAATRHLYTHAPRTRQRGRLRKPMPAGTASARQDLCPLCRAVTSALPPTEHRREHQHASPTCGKILGLFRIHRCIGFGFASAGCCGPAV